MRRVFQLAFWSAIGVTLFFAWVPHPPALIDNDKWQHACAFFLLTLLFFGAYPKLRWYWALSILTILGGMIEVVQAIPSLHRDSDYADWYVDIAAAGAAASAVGLMRWLKTQKWRQASGPQ